MSITLKRIFYKLIIENEYLLSYLGRIWIPENMMREYEYIVEDNTYSLLFAEHTLVYLEGTTSGPLGRRGWEKFWKRRKDFLLFSIICICPGSRWRSGRGVLLGRIFTLYYREYRRWDRSGHKRWVQLSRVSLPPSHSWRRCPASKLWTGPWEWDSWVCLGYKQLSATFIEKWRIGWSMVMWICRFTRPAIQQ